ncbi:MAG: low temperature requirement protein A, partial [Actinomycetota bacterium]|nr:low temperature requirement protein A [Actinomycetota bacterium]
MVRVPVPRIAPTDDSHRVTTIELFFDLVFVFAITQVTALIAA